MDVLRLDKSRDDDDDDDDDDFYYLDAGLKMQFQMDRNLKK